MILLNYIVQKLEKLLKERNQNMISSALASKKRVKCSSAETSPSARRPRLPAALACHSANGHDGKGHLKIILMASWIAADGGPNYPRNHAVSR